MHQPPAREADLMSLSSGDDKAGHDVGVKAAELFDLAGAVALVTGANGGFGSRFVRVLAANGGRVAAAARAPEKLAGLLAKVEQAGGTAAGFRLDVTDTQSIAAAFNEIEELWGKVTLLVNNAGIAHGGPAADVPPETWRNVMSVDLDGPFFVMQEFARRLIAAETPGAVVNIASVIALRAEKGAVAYTAAKAGLIQMTKALALEWTRYKIRVNTLAPGWFPTAINRDFLASEAGEALKKKIPMRRFGDEGDLDGALLLLASNAGAFMTGATIVVDGGEEI
jgi:3-oxoacyl-[acyl-carrier protein] reductase